MPQPSDIMLEHATPVQKIVSKQCDAIPSRIISIPDIHLQFVHSLLLLFLRCRYRFINSESQFYLMHLGNFNSTKVFSDISILFYGCRPKYCYCNLFTEVNVINRRCGETIFGVINFFFSNWNLFPKFVRDSYSFKFRFKSSFFSVWNYVRALTTWPPSTTVVQNVVNVWKRCMWEWGDAWEGNSLLRPQRLPRRYQEVGDRVYE